MQKLAEQQQGKISLNVSYNPTPEANNQLKNFANWIAKQISLHEYYGKKFHLKDWVVDTNENLTMKKTFSQVYQEQAFVPRKKRTRIIKH